MKTFNVQVTVELLMDLEAQDANEAVTKAINSFRENMARLGSNKSEIVDVTVGNVTEVEDRYPFGQSGAV